MTNHNNHSQTLVTGIFCEAFSAADAIRALAESGFAEHEIDLIGVLSGRAPDLSWFLLAMGIPPHHAEYYNACFEHGAVLVMVRTPPSYRRTVALEVIRQHGGVSPSEV